MADKASLPPTMADKASLPMMLLTAAAGGVAAAYADRAFPKASVELLKADAAKPGSLPVVLTPGLMGSAALLLLLASGVKLPAASAVAGLALGGTVYETTKLGVDHVLPLLPVMSGLGPSGYGQMGYQQPYGYMGACSAPDMTQYELQQAFSQFRAAA